MKPSSNSLRALDWTNIFMADVKDGVGVYLSVFLLTVRDWTPDKIGLVIAVPGLVGIVVQPIAGNLIDRTKWKRFLVSGASIIIALCCLVIILMKGFYPTLISQAIVGVVQSVYSPCVAAITLGIVGHALLSARIGRNESFNHLGNMVAAIIAGLIGRFISYEGIFYFSILQCLALVVCVHFIREKDINHELARGAATEGTQGASVSGIKSLLVNRNILLFIVAMALFHLSNGAMLPLIGQKMGLVDKENSSLYLSGAIIIAQGMMVFVAMFAGKRAEGSRKKIMSVAYILLPARAVLFAFIGKPMVLTAIQLLDGIGAGIFGVVSILMIADLSKGTGRFNLLQGVVYSAIGLAGSLSSILGGVLVQHLGYTAGFLILGGIGLLAFFFFVFLVPETRDISTIPEKGNDAVPMPQPHIA